MKNIEFAELLLDYDLILFSVGKIIPYSPKKGSILENIQESYVKHPLKMIKTAVMRWLTHGKTSK